MANFSDTVTSVLLSQPFYGQLLMRYRHVCAPDFPFLAGVSMAQLFYNPARWEALTDDEAIFVLSHEISHGVFQHVPAGIEYHRTGIGPDGQPFDPRLYNEACDYVINAGLKANRVGTMPSTGLISQKYTYEMTPEEVYSDLKKQGSKQKSDGGNSAGEGDGENPNGFDQHIFEPDVDPANGSGATMPAAVTPADIIQAAAVAKTMGPLPLGLDRIIEALRKPKHSPWKMLRRAVQTAVGGNDTATWRKLNRRLIVRGIGAPGRVSFGCNHIGVVVDTSGSIGQEMLELFGGHMGAILTDARPKKISIYWVDAQVHRVDRISNGAQLRTLMSQPVPGGGGTNMPKGVDAAVADKCEAVVVLTDGFTPFGDPSRVPVIWAITEQRVTSPHGTSIHITG